MQVFKLRHIPTGKFHKGGFSADPAKNCSSVGKTWNRKAHLKACITGIKEEGYGCWRSGKGQPKAFARDIAEFEIVCYNVEEAYTVPLTNPDKEEVNESKED